MRESDAGPVPESPRPGVPNGAGRGAHRSVGADAGSAGAAPRETGVRAGAAGGRPSRLAAAIFDLDGTLVDSEPVYLESDARFLAEYGIHLESRLVPRLVGIGTRDFFLALERSFPESPINALPLEERIRRKDESFLSRVRGRNIGFPAMVRLAREFARRGLGLAIASGSSVLVVETVLESCGLRSLFGVVASTTTAGPGRDPAGLPRGKPEPDVFLEAARRLGVAPSACVVIEDTVHGLAAARRAGMPCVVLPAPGSRLSPDFDGADILVEGGPAAADPERLLLELEALGLGGPHLSQ